MKTSIVVPLLLLLFVFNLQADWREESEPSDQLENLVKLVPGTSHWMFEIGERYKNLYWAAKQGRWEFAQYQVEEIEKLIKVVQLARPKRAETAQEFIETGLPAISDGVESRNWDDFKPAFVKLNQACMTCHGKNDHAFITLPVEPLSASSPVLNLPE
ncbi:MAG: hypothetical protein JAY99_00290 [Candidatus Thiodiazotropha lotti]|uniref:Cytochrome C n=1 Tax=Candidatus Thiodiazotropha endoloripes TaxID=1818881 RepID=A0A1E2UP73_9GAMM|nr:hypothetical protein [Candidatus Thiodiazotropha endoloripes]MCG7897806.1 hypothetical protein [Candidatus Thiodiazotropha weberae]MCG7993536.1 hypothetical protein [Candidatus Thiodiazotropha lotti]MCG7901215.1 hypothetical protein [Candidatus Thiodiazotropha weberae]MCG7914432.1 hypothetical protein [Candidatus Thiodiazotropha weberae]MCG7997945.1 hypothetical protein [Candidatus Thiodiazotropha lotti]